MWHKSTHPLFLLLLICEREKKENKKIQTGREERCIISQGKNFSSTPFSPFLPLSLPPQTSPATRRSAFFPPSSSRLNPEPTCCWPTIVDRRRRRRRRVQKSWQPQGGDKEEEEEERETGQEISPLPSSLGQRKEGVSLSPPSPSPQKGQ